MRNIRVCVCLLSLLLLWSAEAVAAQRVTYLVLPFVVTGPEKAVNDARSLPQMLTSRLYVQGQMEPAGEASANQSGVADEKTAERLRASARADYVIFGSMTVSGDMMSLDVRVRNAAGKIWPISHESPARQFLSSVNVVSNAIKNQVFGINTGPSFSSQAHAPTPVNQMHPDIVVNQDRPKDVYLNPQFRYAGPSDSDQSRQRSQRLNFAAVGMDVGDLDGDGRNEVVVLGSSQVNVYRFAGADLKPLDSFDLPKTYRTLLVRIFNGHIIVNMVDGKSLAKTAIFSFKGGKITPVAQNLQYFLNVVRLAPSFENSLIGQKSNPNKIFGSGVFRMQINSGTLVQGEPISLPASANVFNFAHLPGSGSSDGDKIITLTDKEKLRTHTMSGSRIAESDEVFSGAAVGFELRDAVAGLAQSDSTQLPSYYIPMRMVPIDLERDGSYELLVNKPISTASSIFDRYRFFPQSEIHSLFWDGVGLNLQWKTRRIKGSTVDYTVADADNNGVLDLVVCINTHPGATGTSTRRAVVLMYPLDTSQVNQNTAPYVGDIND